MRRLSGRERSLVMFAAAAVVGFVLLFGVGLPMRDRGVRLAEEEEELSGKIEEAARMHERTPAIREEIETLAAEAEGVMFPWEDVKEGVVREIAKLAAEWGMDVTNLTPPGEAEAVSGCLKYSASVTGGATFAQMVRLLYELEQPSRRLWVEAVDITSGHRGGEKLTVTVHLAVYARAKGSEEGDAKA